MEHISGLDIVLAGVVVVSGLFALFRGLMSEMLGIGSWIVSGVGGVYLLPYVTPVTDKYISNSMLSNAAAGIASSIVLLIILTMICSFITGKVRKSAFSGIDHGLGFLFGCARGILILGLVYFLVFLLAPQTLESMRQGSVLFPHLEELCLKAKNHLPESLFDNPSEEDDDADDTVSKKKSKKTKTGSEELDSVLRAISKDEIDIAVEEAKKLPEDDPLRQMLKEEAAKKPAGFFDNLLKKLTESPQKNKALFDKLNTPEIKAKDSKELYKKKDKEDLNRLILENLGETEGDVP